MGGRNSGGWDEYLFKGAAEFYERGRLPYADGLGGVLRDELGLDGGSTVADLGCGPGTLARAVASYVRRVVAVDPDPEMVDAGRALAGEDRSIGWVTAAAEDVRFGAGELDAVLFGQSFHWMDRDLVADRLRAALRPGGNLVLIADVKTPRSAPPQGTVPVPAAEVTALVAEYLGEQRRAGRTVLASGTPGDEETVLAAAGYAGPRRIVVPATRLLRRTVDDVVAEVYSKSFFAPHLFGERLVEFDGRLRELLERHAEQGLYPTVAPDTDVRVWTNPPTA